MSFDKHSMRIIGTADDTFNERGIVLELRLLTKKMKTKQQLILMNKMMKLIQQTKFQQLFKKDTKLSLAKYYLTFFLLDMG